MEFLPSTSPLTKDELELAWAAGFYDGEGSTHIRLRRKIYPTLVCSIGQVGRQPLDRFVSAVGLGTVNGPYRIDKWSAGFYKLQITGAQAKMMLELLWPYLSEPKKEQARSKGYSDIRDID